MEDLLMLKDKLFLNFVAKRPIAVAFQMVFTRLFAPHILDDLFANVAKGTVSAYFVVFYDR